MIFLATGLSGTIGKKIDKEIQSAKLVLGSEKLADHFKPTRHPITLIHLAGIVGEEKVNQNLTYSKLINVDETLRLAREVIENFNGRFIHISSSHVYGSNNSVLSETSPLDPQSNYAIQKMVAEQLLNKHFGENHPQLVILRVFSILGWDVPDFTLGGAVKRILSGSKESIANSDDVRDFMTPTSVGRAISKIAKESHFSGTYNLCTGLSITVGEAVRSMFELKNFQEFPSHILSGISKVPRIIGDNRKLVENGLHLELKWDPKNDMVAKN